ncbi:hypothetical protein GCM10023094_21770 [Rhodococcus olei]|uniref:DUF6777 domain-containing protein n=1 Tax=Rhodococcus olei TaxID=2161675 RepID=A0ABP8NYZ1_9NOCA
MAPDIGGRTAHRARRRAVATTGPRPAWPVTSFAVGCALLAVASVACSRPPARPDPVALIAVVQDDEQPWTDRLLPPQTPTQVPPGPAGSELPADVAAGTTGDRAGLYGGSPDRPLCDRSRLADDLERDPVRAAAWSRVQRVDDVRGYVDTLTPVLLRADTRVSSYGYDDGRATPREAVLEAGTIVLIDDHGVPRVRCSHGSPLGAPTSRVGPNPHSVPWPGFETDRVLVVRPALEAMGAVSVVDLATGALTTVPVGSGTRPDPVPAVAPVATGAPVPTRIAQVEQPPRREVVEAPPPAPAPPPPPPPAPEPPPAPVAVPQPPPPPRPVAPPPEIRVEVPGLPPLVIPLPK